MQQTPELIRRAWENNLYEMNLLFQKGTDVSVRDVSGSTALHFAVISKNLKMCQTLIDHKADVNAADQLLFTPLHFAAQEYVVDIARLLIEKGAVIDAQNKYGNTPLTIAVLESRGRGEMIQLLLGAGADPHQKNNSGVSPLQIAESIANFDVKKFFKK